MFNIVKWSESGHTPRTRDGSVSKTQRPVSKSSKKLKLWGETLCLGKNRCQMQYELRLA